MIIKYDKNGNPYVYSDKSVIINDQWRKKTSEEFRKKYGAWWIFVGTSSRKKKTWIEQFRKKGV